MDLSRVIGVSVAKTTIATSAGGMLHRSAIFMVCFLFVHMFSNLTVFFGKDIFNGYAVRYASNPAVKVVEYYLLVTACIHLITAAYFTYNKARYISKKPISNGKLAITGALLSICLYKHLFTFRFKEDRGSRMRDLYQQQKDLFADPKQLAFYLASIGPVGVHLWYGWTKAVLKMDARIVACCVYEYRAFFDLASTVRFVSGSCRNVRESVRIFCGALWHGVVKR